MHKGDTIPGILTTLFGFIFFYAALMAPNLHFRSTTSDNVPGAGFFPYIIGGLVMALGIVLTIRGLCQKGRIQYFVLNEERKGNLKVLGLTILGLLAFMVFWQTTRQFIIAVFALCLYLNWVFKRTWKFNLIYSGVFTAFIYLLFTVAFSIQFGI